MTAKALNCPNCGAGVASDSSRCQFCRTRLKTMACPSCVGLMFVGSKFCEHCGAIAAPVNVDLEHDAGDCPRCRKPLESSKAGETPFRGCAECDGIWLDAQIFERLCADKEKQSVVLAFLASRTVRANKLTKINYVPCPECQQLMNRNNFARSSGVIVDICKQHGLWFDADELSAIFEFIQKGGIEMARKREVEELKTERSKLRAERLSGDKTIAMFEKEENPGVISFVRSLFE